MNVEIETTGIRDVLVVHHEVFRDARGFFTEVFRRDVFLAAGLPTAFAQVNHSRSAGRVVRGLHFQWEPPMGKLMRVVKGSAFLVAVDIRKGSPTLGKWHAVELQENDGRQLWAPAGFARGFCVTSEWAEMEYICTGTYNSAAESGIRWNDPEIGITWPVADPVLSDKDRTAQPLAAWLSSPASSHFSY